jgi:hypothetical protein
VTVRLRPWLLATAAAIAAAALALSAHAASPPRVEGEDCRVLAAAIGKNNVWQTTFWATGKDVFDRPVEFFAAPCFRTQATCKAWLYWARSDWDPNYVQPQPCTRGVR